MNPKNDLTQSGQPRPTLSPAPRKRFRIDKLEERIAPRGKPSTDWCPGGSGGRSGNRYSASDS